MKLSAMPFDGCSVTPFNAHSSKNKNIFTPVGKVSPGHCHFALTLVTMCGMDKKDAIKLLGGTPAKAAAAMGYQTVHAIYMWPDTLPLGMVDRVHGALLRIKTERRLARAAAKMGGQNKPQLSGDGTETAHVVRSKFHGVQQ